MTPSAANDTKAKLAPSVGESPTEKLRILKDKEISARAALMLMPKPDYDAGEKISAHHHALIAEWLELTKEIRLLEATVVVHQAASSVASLGYGAWQVEDRACGDFAVDQVHYVSKKVRRWAVFADRQSAHDCAMSLNILREVRP